MTATPMTSPGEGRFATARKVADAVIYEGYVLYPYRASAQKNQVRWQFGVLAPRPFSESTGSEAWAMQTECVLEAPGSASVSVQVRFLRVLSRVVEEVPRTEGDAFTPVASLEVDGELWTTWEESSEQQIDLGPVALGSLVHAGTSAADETAITLEGRVERELLRNASGLSAGRVVREHRPVCGRIGVSASAAEQAAGADEAAHSRSRISRPGPVIPARSGTRSYGHSLVAVHVLAAVDGGGFISLLDPPEHCRRAPSPPAATSAASRSLSASRAPTTSSWRRRSSSTTIPKLRPESQGDMFDATEIDEILALRILTLTEEEKREARGTDTLSRLHR